MGCTYEIFYATVPNDIATDFVEAFFECFRKEMYWVNNEEAPLSERIDESTVKINKSNMDNFTEIHFESDPFFRMWGMEDDVLNFFKNFCSKHRKSELFLDYYTEFSEDSASQYLNYSYKDGMLKGFRSKGYGWSLDTCPICNAEFDIEDENGDTGLFSLATFNPRIKYFCPICGSEICTKDWDYKIETILLNDTIS